MPYLRARFIALLVVEQIAVPVKVATTYDKEVAREITVALCPAATAGLRAPYSTYTLYRLRPSRLDWYRARSACRIRASVSDCGVASIERMPMLMLTV